MTTLISKILTLFVTVASVGFMAVAIASSRAGGPNWVARSQEIPEVAFDRANPQAPWTAKKRTDGSDLGGGAILPDAIVKAQKRLIEAERTVQTSLDQQINARKLEIAEAKALIAVDLDAMQRRQADLDAQFLTVEKQLEQISQDYTQEAKKQIDDLDLLKLRAEEYIRVKNQLEELKAQREVATDELDRLQALLYQARANLDRVQTRQKLLGSESYDTQDEQAAPQDNQSAPDKQPEAEENKPGDKPEAEPKSE